MCSIPEHSIEEGSDKQDLTAVDCDVLWETKHVPVGHVVWF